MCVFGMFFLEKSHPGVTFNSALQAASEEWKNFQFCLYQNLENWIFAAETIQGRKLYEEIRYLLKGYSTATAILDRILNEIFEVKFDLTLLLKMISV